MAFPMIKGTIQLLFSGLCVIAARHNHVTANVTAAIVLFALALANIAEAAFNEARKNKTDRK